MQRYDCLFGQCRTGAGNAEGLYNVPAACGVCDECRWQQGKARKAQIQYAMAQTWHTYTEVPGLVSIGLGLLVLLGGWVAVQGAADPASLPVVPQLKVEVLAQNGTGTDWSQPRPPVIVTRNVTITLPPVVVPEDEPVPKHKPVPEHEPVPEYEPIPEHKPVPEHRPVPKHEPVPKDKPMPENKPIPEHEPVPKDQPLSEDQPADPPKAQTPEIVTDEHEAGPELESEKTWSQLWKEVHEAGPELESEQKTWSQLWEELNDFEMPKAEYYTWSQFMEDLKELEEDWE